MINGIHTDYYDDHTCIFLYTNYILIIKSIEIFIRYTTVISIHQERDKAMGKCYQESSKL